MDQKCNIKDNGLHYLTGVNWKQRQKRLPYAELGNKHTLPLVWRSTLSLESSWEFNLANEGLSSSIVFITVLPMNTKLTITCQLKLILKPF